MKSLVNLASDPFRNRRLFRTGVFLLFLVPAWFGRQAIGSMSEQEQEIARRKAIIAELESRTGRGEKPKAGTTSISSDKNRELFAASELLARKTFSWAQLLNDIERNIPPGVRVLRVAVTTVLPEERNGAFGGPESSATLVLDVIGKNNLEVTTMINSFHDSGRFRVFPVTQKPVEGTEEVEFSLKIDYFPVSSPPSVTIASARTGEKTGEEAGGGDSSAAATTKKKPATGAPAPKESVK